MHRIVCAAVLLWISTSTIATSANAAGICDMPASTATSPQAGYAERIAAAACDEHRLWFRPFIDADGKLASTTVAEAEASRLSDGATEAWRRVAGYWRDSGLLSQMSGFRGANECGYAGAEPYLAQACRAFVIDNPWSAAFVSYVMAKAALPGFRASASHADYVAHAYLDPDDSAYQFLDPATTAPAAGDLLCFVRSPATVLGHAGLKAFFDGGGGALAMHCDIVVAVGAGNGARAHLIGGNVLQGVTMRMLNVNRNGLFWSLPQRFGADPLCAPETPSACNFNRQDWAALLKLKPPALLARLPRYTYDIPPSIGVPSQPAQPSCCVNCVVGSGVPRCVVPKTP